MDSASVMETTSPLKGNLRLLLSNEDNCIPFKVKFLGQVLVDNPKGAESLMEATEIIKPANSKNTSKQKPVKVELQVSSVAVKILDIKTKLLLHSAALRNISFCAVNDSCLKIFGYIAKDGESKKHRCYLFESAKYAHDAILTIAGAFDMFQSKHEESKENDSELRNKIASIQQQNQTLIVENESLKKRIKELEKQLKLGPAYGKLEAEHARNVNSSKVHFSSSKADIIPTNNDTF